ncbi:MAG: hypothetical protein K1X88_03115 [Nannocystaceae bacterium]|nr:hypothetical protein [Nannocystaceae bacterium]
MNRLRIVGFVAGLGVALGLIVWAVGVSSREDTAPVPTGRTAAARDGDGPPAKGTPRAAAQRVRTAGRDQTKPTTTRVVGPAAAAANAEPVDFDKTLDELEQFVERLEDTAERGERIPQPRWVETYREGNTLVDALMRTPEAASDDQRKLVMGLNERFRKAIMRVERPPGPDAP